MTSLHDTAYPRLKTTVSAQDLLKIYTPTPTEKALAAQSTKGAVAYVGFLILLKTFQRLGYFVYLTEVPPLIVQHIAQATGHAAVQPTDLAGYDLSGTRKRHLAIIREYRQVRAYGPEARHLIIQVMGDAARTKDEPADLVNVALEELLRQRFELPAFDTLARAAYHVRATVYRQFYQQVATRLTPAEQAQLNQLFIVNPATHFTPWHTLKRDPSRPTLTHFKELLDQKAWLAGWSLAPTALAEIPDVKVKHFAAEAKTLDAARMAALEPYKRYTLALALLTVQTTRLHDDLAETFVKRMLALHKKGREALAEDQVQQRPRTDELVTLLRDVVTAYRTKGSFKKRIRAVDAVMSDSSEAVIEKCEAHLACAGNNYYPFLWRYFKSHRPTLFRLLKTLTLQSTTQDTALEAAVQFALSHERATAEFLPAAQLDLSWVPDKWWPLVTGQPAHAPAPQQINRRHFEVCLFSQIMWELKSGDLCVAGGDHFADYRAQLISWETYAATVAEYGQMLGFPVTGPAFVQHFQAQLEAATLAAETTFPKNAFIRLDKAGELIVSRPPKIADPDGLPAFETLLAQRMAPVTLLDVLSDTEQWLNWTRFFGPISGHDAKLDDPSAKYLSTVFCYGSRMGPTQTARSLRTVERRQLSWINLRHITEDNLDQANRVLMNAYHRFALPRYWGTGKRVSADGTKWNVYEQNLLSEYHIRYGGYGGIGYYHVADTYLALFSHFIPCGVWEAVYLLDALLTNDTEIQPEIIHADTQGQSAPVFALAALLGITLMPRIRNWKDLKLLRSRPGLSYPHLDRLLTPQTVNWDLIATHLPDMLRVVLSIKAGKLTPSTLLRKLGTYSQKNRLYQAFRELGQALRTGYQLHYITDEKLRAIVQATTNKGESFNHFVHWLGFGSEGVITENDRDEQRKMIKYNHLLANCVIFYNVFAMSRVLRQLQQEGQAIEPELIAAISPYLTQHINRFGRYILDVTRQPPPLNYDLFSPQPSKAPPTPPSTDDPAPLQQLSLM